MDIYLINTNISQNIPEEMLQEFNYKNRKRNNIHSLTYLMLDRILKEAYTIPDREIIFNSEKPELKSGGKHFSVSHSGEYIALAFSDSECGIDIEKIKKRGFKAISKRMGFVSESLEDLYYNWTEYEATYKLGRQYASIDRYKIDNYIITTVSSNPDENFELYKSI